MKVGGRRSGVRKGGGLLLLVLLLLPLLLLAGPAKLRDRLQGQLTLKVLAHKLTRGVTSDRDRALAIFRYLHEHLYTPPGGKPAGSSVQEVLLRNIAWCNQQADILAVLARRLWINGGYVLLYGYDAESHHSVCVLDIEGGQRMFDPFYGYVFEREDGGIATLEDIRERGAQLPSEQFQAMRTLTRDAALDYFRLYEPAHPWDVHIPRTPIWIKYIDFYYDLFGDPFRDLYQDLYFRAADTDLFTRARLKHLTWRFDQAIADYTEVIERGCEGQPEVLLIDYDRVTPEILKAEALFFRGQAYRDKGEYEACIASLETLVAAYPRNRWTELAYYYLGEAHERLGRPGAALDCYLKIEAKRLNRTPAPARIVRLQEARRAHQEEIHDRSGSGDVR